MSFAKTPIKFFSGTASMYLSEKIAASYGTELGKSSMLYFSDGEFQPSLDETVRGCTAFIVQSTFPPVDNLFEMLMMIDAARRASAYKIVAVMPYFGWARQDRKDKPRVPIGAKLVADLLNAAHVDRIMTMDLHADQIQGFFNVPVDHLYASSLFVPYIKSLDLDNLIVAAPDMGGTKRANAYSRFLQAEMAICYKNRKKANEVEDITVIGNVKDKNVVIIDDMIDTAGTICLAAEIMMNAGAKTVRVVATHPVLSGKAHERIANSAITEVIVTDTIPQKQHNDKIKVITVADLFADVIKKVYNYQSISTTFIT
ncbi:MAG: ribose-phosphate pyrophosphokinase [Bacteroidetes bacterium HGW-Bacteroidetes-21]|nr:MAG: ribose-phosphate pyrophosphokinase [Bacteroidetes bacterium HGW-Bacteroidetes-21]